MSFLVKLCHPCAKTPQKATPGSAGFDVSSCEDVTIPPYGGREMINTGVALSFSPDCYVRVAPRSGLAAKHGIDVLAGVIDSDFCKEIKVILINHGKEDFIVKTGDRIAQLIVERISENSEFQLVDVFPPHIDDGHLGFGSTGRN